MVIPVKRTVVSDFIIDIVIPTSLNCPSAMAIAGFDLRNVFLKLMNLYSAGITLLAKK
jgi:hypothetical protein